MKLQMLDHARRPAPLRARQKTALSATERDCFAFDQKPKRFAVRDCASPGCCARRRLPPTAMKKRRRDRIPAANRGHCGVQMCHQVKCPLSAIFHKHALPLSLLRKILSRDSTAFRPNLRRIRAINRPRFSRHSAKNPRRFLQQCAIYPPRFGHVRNVSVVFPRLLRFSIRARSVHSVAQNIHLSASPSDHQTVCVSRIRPLPKRHLALAQCRVGRLLGSLPFAAASKRRRFFLFASMVAFRASSNGGPNLSCRVVLSGVVGLLLGALAAAPGCVKILRILFFAPVACAFKSQVPFVASVVAFVRHVASVTLLANSPAVYQIQKEME
jgi:hypothetical protein